MNALKTALERVCNDSTPPPSTVQQWSYPVNWTSVPFTQIGTTNLKTAATFAFTIPSVVPSSAKEMLINAACYTTGGSLQYIKIFTQIGTTKYEKYLMLYTYSGSSGNSDNMWFPMPPNRRIYLTLQTAVGSSAGAYLNAIGYR